jgi:hypothetical protein
MYSLLRKPRLNIVEPPWEYIQALQMPGNVIGPLILGSIAELYGLKLTLQLSAFIAFLGSVSATPLIYSKK